jgi:hypothetical protein
MTRRAFHANVALLATLPDGLGRGIKTRDPWSYSKVEPGCEHTRLTGDPEINGRIVLVVVKRVKIGSFVFFSSSSQDLWPTTERSSIPRQGHDFVAAVRPDRDDERPRLSGIPSKPAEDRSGTTDSCFRAAGSIE